MILKIWISKKCKDLVVRVSEAGLGKIMASLLIALSGLLLYLDKVILFLEIEGTNTFGFADYPTFIWVLMQSLAPIIMIIAFNFRPYSTACLVPVYCYTIQIVWTFDPNMRFDQSLLHVYAIGSCVAFVLLFFLFKKISNWRRIQISLKEEFQQETQEILHILKSKTVTES